MDPNDNKLSTPSRPANEDFQAEDDPRTARETTSLTDARINGAAPAPTTPQTPRDAWAHIAPSSQRRIVPATRESQADRDAQEIVNSTQRALETLRKSSDPRSLHFVSPPVSTASVPQRRSTSPFRPFSGSGHSLNSHNLANGGVASPQTSVRTAAALSPDVRTGLENSGRSAALAHHVRSRPPSTTRTAVEGSAKKSRGSRKSSGCNTLHTATANYEIDLRKRTNSMTGPTSDVSTARTIPPVSPMKRSSARVLDYNSNEEASVQSGIRSADFPPLPSEGDPNEQSVELAAERMDYSPHISTPIVFGDGVRTARSHSPARIRTLSERTAISGNPGSSVRTGRSPAQSPARSLATTVTARSYKTNSQWSPQTSVRIKKATRSQKQNSRDSESQSSLATTTARSYQSAKSWATAPSKESYRKNLRTTSRSTINTAASLTGRSSDASSFTNSGASRRASRGRHNDWKSIRDLNNRTQNSTKTCVSPDAQSSLRSPPRTARENLLPVTPDTPKGWPYIAFQQTQQTGVRIAPSSAETAALASPPNQYLKTAKSPAQRSQKEVHREAKSRSESRRSSNAPTSGVSTARTMTSHYAESHSGRSSTSSMTNPRTFSTATMAAAKYSKPQQKTEAGPDFIIQTKQANGLIEIDLCFTFRVRSTTLFGEPTSSPLHAKEVLVNGTSIWKKE